MHDMCAIVRNCAVYKQTVSSNECAIEYRGTQAIGSQVTAALLLTWLIDSPLYTL